MARRELVIACALIGALGGALFGFVFARGNGDWLYWKWSVVVSLTVCTTISATLLGRFLALRGGDPNVASSRAAWTTFVAGALNGVLMVIAMALTRDTPGGGHLPELFIAGAIFGVLCALPFAPAIIVVTATAAWGDARAESIAARSQGRRVVRNAMVCVGVAAALITPTSRAPLIAHLPAYVLALALAIVIGTVVAEFLVRRSLVPDNHAWEPAPAGMTAERSVDYGLGFELVMRRAHDETYREGVRPLELRRGDVHRAREVVEGSMRGHAIAALATAAALFVTIASR